MTDVRTPAPAPASLRRCPPGLDTLLHAGALRAVYQPIVRLETREVVAYEALARGPRGSRLESPAALFAAAAAAGRTGELDRRCRATAIQGARHAGLRAPHRLFVNVEPAVLDLEDPDELELLHEQTRAGVDLVLEFTERHITARPDALLAMVEHARRNGWGVAVDDVGAGIESLALMPLLRPDVIKLDLRLVQERTSTDTATIVNAVNAEAESTGAVLLAEGIETEQQAALALSMGATFGQGWLFGRPGALPSPAERRGSSTTPASRLPLLPSAALPDRHQTPFEAVTAGRPPRRATKPLLLAMTRRIEDQIDTLGEKVLVLSTFEHARYFTAATKRRYRKLASQAVMVVALAEDLGETPAPGVRGSHLEDDDPVRHEWDIVVVAPHFAAALVAHDLGDAREAEGGVEAERRFDYVLTYDRERVLRAATALLRRVRRGGSEPSGGLAIDPRVLRLAIDAAPTGMSIADATRPGFPLVYVNSAFERMTGYPSEEALDRSCSFLQGPTTEPEAVAEMASALRAGRESRVVVRNHRRDGSPWWNEIHLTPVRDDEGRVVQYVGIQNDVTARVDAETALREQRDRAERYLEIAGTAILATDRTGAIVMANRATRQLLGRTEEELEGADAASLCTVVRERPRFRALAARALGDRGEPERDELALEDTAGERHHVRWTVRTLPDENGRPVGVLYGGEEVTEQRLAQESTRLLEDGSDQDELLAAADRRMYAGKHRRHR